MLAISSWAFFGAAGDRQVANSSPDSKKSSSEQSLGDGSRSLQRYGSTSSESIALRTPAINCDRCSRSEKKLEQERELLFQQFDDTSEWVAVCQDALFRYVLKRVFPEGITEIQSTASTTAPSRPDGAMQTRLSDTEQGLPEQLRRVFVAIGDAAERTRLSAIQYTVVGSWGCRSC